MTLLALFVDKTETHHIFWSCIYVRSFWEQFQNVLNAGCSNATSVTLNENTVLLGHNTHFKSDSTFDYFASKVLYL